MISKLADQNLRCYAAIVLPQMNLEQLVDFVILQSEGGLHDASGWDEYVRLFVDRCL